MTKTVFAFDVGNGYVKAKSERRELVAPSYFAKEASLGASSLIGLIQGEKHEYNTYESQLDDGTKYVWGKDILKAVDPKELINTYTHNDRYNQKRFKLLCLFILAELASDYTEEELKDVAVVTGLPSQEVGTEEAKQFKTFLEQKHLVTREGEQKVINITDVRVVEQPTGTLLNKFMNDSGGIHKDLLTKTITVIDFGAGTTIVDTFKNLKRVEDKSETYYVGMNDLHKQITKRLERENNIKGLDSSYVDKGFRRGDLIVDISERKKFLFEDIAKDVIMEFVDNTLSNIDTALTNRDSIDLFILTGGGVNIVGNSFKEGFNEESLLLVEDAQQSNLEGFFKLAKTIA